MKSIVICTVAAVGGLGVASMACASYLDVAADQNLGAYDEHTSDGAFVSASIPANPQGGFAAATMTEVTSTAQSYGYGTGVDSHLDANAHGTTNYQLIDLRTGAPLTYDQALGINLNFNFRLSGTLNVDPVSLSSAYIDFQLQLFSNTYSFNDANLDYVYGPGPGGNAYFASGDTSLIGNVNRTFSELHSSDASGSFGSSIYLNVFNSAYADFNLHLDSVTFAGYSVPSARGAFSPMGIAPFTDPIGVQLEESGQVIDVSPVPEPSSVALMLAGLAALAGVARKAGRKVPSAPNPALPPPSARASGPAIRPGSADRRAGCGPAPARRG